MTTRYEFIQPQCNVPAKPSLPKIKSEELESLANEAYWKLGQRETRIVDWAMQMQAILEPICNPEKYTTPDN